MKASKTTAGCLWALLCSVGLWSVSALAQSSGEYSVMPTTIDGGGVRSSAGSLEVSGAIGQADAGRLTGGSFEITGGFWLEVRRGDLNADGIVNVADHGVLVSCWTGPVAGSTNPDCAPADMNGDARVDLRDFGYLQSALLSGG